MKNQFKIIQKLLGNIFDRRGIIFHHSDHLKAKVEWVYTFRSSEWTNFLFFTVLRVYYLHITILMT